MREQLSPNFQRPGPDSVPPADAPDYSEPERFVHAPELFPERSPVPDCSAAVDRKYHGAVPALDLQSAWLAAPAGAWELERAELELVPVERALGDAQLEPGPAEQALDSGPDVPDIEVSAAVPDIAELAAALDIVELAGDLDLAVLADDLGIAVARNAEVAVPDIGALADVLGTVAADAGYAGVVLVPGNAAEAAPVLANAPETGLVAAFDLGDADPPECFRIAVGTAIRVEN